MAIPSEFPFLHHGKKVFVHSNCILYSAVNLLVRHLVFVVNVPTSPTTSHLKGLLLYVHFLVLLDCRVQHFYLGTE